MASTTHVSRILHSASHSLIPLNWKPSSQTLVWSRYDSPILFWVQRIICSLAHRPLNRQKRRSYFWRTFLFGLHPWWLWVMRVPRVVLLRRMSWTDIHAFLAWFDISFECTHKKVKFSTGPHAQYTHWKSVSRTHAFCVVPDLKFVDKPCSTLPTP